VCFSFQYSFFASDCWRLNYDLFENDFVGVVNLADTMLSGYNVDQWTMTTLRKGDVVYGGLPGQSNYYTTADSVLASGGNKDILGQSLQVKPHAKLGYRPDIAEYALIKDMRVPTSIISANPRLGVGNSTQFFINKNHNMLRVNNEYSLERFYEINMSRNRYRN